MYISDQSKVAKRKTVCYLNSRYKLVGRQSWHVQAWQGAPHVLCPVMLCHSYVHIYTYIYTQYTFWSNVRVPQSVRRTLEVQTKKLHLPVVDRTPLEPPLIVVAVVGPPKGGKITLISSRPWYSTACTDQSTTPPSVRVCWSLTASHQCHSQSVRRTLDMQTKKLHLPLVDRMPLEPPPIVVAVACTDQSTTIWECVLIVAAASSHHCTNATPLAELL